MSNLKKRWLYAKDYLNDPSFLDSYPHKYVLLVDFSRDVSHQNLLMAIEQMESRDWMLHSITCTGSVALMCALLYHKQ